MDSELVESIAEVSDVPLNPLSRLWLTADNFAHRVRLGLTRRWDRTPMAAREGWLGRTIDASRRCNVRTLSHDPAVFLVAIGGARPLWMVERLSASLAGRPALFLLLIYWSVENPTTFEFMRRNAERHRARFPRHTLLFLCNTIEEQHLIEAAGFEAIFANQNQLVSEQIFRPLTDTHIAFGAAYTAKLARFKRHHLAAAIERVIHVTYRDLDDMSRSASRAYMQRLLSRSPGHRFANDIANGLPRHLTPAEVNAAYNRAAVGLCLSPVEGAMFSSLEYLLAGLPVVTTPSRGGRDVFFDPDYCVTVAPDPRAIRDAVSALRLKAIPREVVRQRTLKRVEAARQQSLSSIREVLTRFGLALDAAAIWPPIGGSSIVKCQAARAHIADYLAAGRSISH